MSTSPFDNPNLVNQSICNFYYDSSGQPYACWFVTEDAEEMHATASFVHQLLRFDDAEVSKNWHGSNIYGAKGGHYYFVCISGTDDSAIDIHDVSKRINAHAQNEAELRKKKSLERLKAMTAAERRQFNAEFDVKSRDTDIRHFNIVLSRVHWTWHTEDLDQLYVEAKGIAYDFDRQNRLFGKLLIEIEGMETLSDRFFHLDRVGAEQGMFFQRFDSLLKSMEKQVGQLILDDDEFGPRYFGTEALHIIYCGLGDTSGNPRNYEFVFQLRDRAIPAAIAGEVTRRDRGRCVICGSQNELEMDHILPFARGGDHTVENLRLLCYECHRRRDTFVFWKAPRVETMMQAMERDKLSLAPLRDVDTRNTLERFPARENQVKGHMPVEKKAPRRRSRGT